MSKRSIGPWRVYAEIDADLANGGVDTIFQVFDANSELVCECIGGKNGDEKYHNAHLIAAAPELLEALVDLYCVAKIERDEDYAAVTNAVAVIAKATGEQP